MDVYALRPRDMIPPVSAEEKKKQDLIKRLGDIVADYQKLKCYQTSDGPEFREAIHVARNVIIFSSNPAKTKVVEK